jgi:cyanate permease
MYSELQEALAAWAAVEAAAVEAWVTQAQDRRTWDEHNDTYPDASSPD